MLRWSFDELIREVKSDPNVVHSTDSKGATLIHYAAKEGRTDAIEFLIDNGGIIDAKDNEDNTPSHWAICYNHPKTLRILLDAGADVTILNHAKMAPIHLACDKNRPEMIEILASRKDFDPNLIGDLGQAPIHFCATKDSEEAAKKILEYKPKLCICDNHGVFPVHCAATHASRKVLEVLLSEGEKYGYTREVQFSFKDKENNTPLHAAVNGGCEIAIQVCLDSGAPPDVQQDDDSTPLHLACSQGALGMVKLLIKADKGLRTLSMRDVEQMTPLHKAAMFDHMHVVEFLLDMGAEMDAFDKHCRTPLLLATSRGAWRTASFLIHRGASHTFKDDQSRNLMHLMVLSGGNINILGVEISEKGGIIHLINDTDNHGCTPMHYATRDGNIKSLQGLLELGATVKLKNKDKQSPLHFAARYGRFNSCKRLLDSSIGPNIINDTDGKGMTALHIAAWNGHSKVIQLLMLRGALLHRDHEGRTPLHLAAMAGYVDTMKALLGTHSHLLDQVTCKGESALHVAARKGQAKSVKYLLTAGACFSTTHNGQTVFDIVIEEKNQDVAMTLITHDRWHETLSNYSKMDQCPVALLIEHMPEVMMKVLDRCLTISEHDAMSVDFWVNYDFRYLEPTVCCRKEIKQCAGFDIPPLPALNAMVRHNQVDLLSHPLCIEYLNSKWCAYGGPIHYGYILIYLLFVGFFTYFIATLDPTPIMVDDGTVSHNINGTTNYQQVHSVGQHIALTYIMIYACLNIIKEFFQMFSQGIIYFTSIENYAEWCLYVSTLVFATPFWFEVSNHYQWAAGSIAIFYAWFNFLMYQQRIDRIGIYIVMFYEILNTIVHVMLVFSVIIIAFGLSFYMLMSGEINHAFISPEISIFRVFSMMLGELDFINSFVMPLTDGNPATLHYTYLSYILLVAVVILLPILLMNLLIGLAVGDIASVQRNARLKRLAMQVDLHSEFEPKLPWKILEWVTKDNITLRPNAVCSRGTTLTCFDKVKEKYIVQTGGNKRFQSIIEMKNGEEKRCQGEFEKLKKRMRGLSSKLDKQYDLMRLIVQKMEIHSEADEQDEGEAPPGEDGHRMRLRLNMSQVVTAAMSTFNANRLHKRNMDADKGSAVLSLTPRTGSPTSDIASVTNVDVI
ncbi:transient receptor potential cation channel subfamily A member 1-like isoform X2 [Amphiura filiformis]